MVGSHSGGVMVVGAARIGRGEGKGMGYSPGG